MTGALNLKRRQPCRSPKRPSNALPPKATFAVPRASAPASRPLPVYDPDDLQKIKDAHIPRVEIITQADAPQQQPALVPRLDLPSFLYQSFVNGADVPLRDKLFFQRQRGGAVFMTSPIHDPAFDPC